MKVKSIAECLLGAFCNTFDLHKAIVGLENQFWPLFEVLLYLLLVVNSRKIFISFEENIGTVQVQSI